MNKRSKAAATGVATAAMLLGVMAGTGSAKQPVDPIKPIPPLSNACLKVGDTWRSAFDFMGRPLSGTCETTNPAGFSADDVDRLTRGCSQAAENFGAARFDVVLFGGSLFVCNLTYPA